MHIAASLFILFQTVAPPSYFGPVVLVLLIGGALGWFVAATLGFARARAFGASARWFATAAVCLVLFHLQFLALAFGVFLNDLDLIFGLGAFFNIFVVLAAICAILGFVRLTNPH